jgi:hypothetical protein
MTLNKKDIKQIKKIVKKSKEDSSFLNTILLKTLAIYIMGFLSGIIFGALVS